MPGVVTVQDQHPQRDRVNDRSPAEPPRDRGLPRVVVITTPHCPNCRVIKPDLDAVGEEYLGRVHTEWVDASLRPGVAAELGVHGVPTLVAFHSDGTAGGRLVGRAGAGDHTALYESALDPARQAPTGISSTDRWLRTIAGVALTGIGLIATNIPIIAVGALLTTSGWYDRLAHRRSSLR